MTEGMRRGRPNFLRSVPVYVWSVLALVVGIVLGGMLPEPLSSVAGTTRTVIKLIVQIVPLLILAALSPAIATLIKRGLAGRFAASVIGWYVITSFAAGFIGVIVSSVYFDIPFRSGTSGTWSEAVGTFSGLGTKTGASRPLLAIAGAVVVGVAAIWIPPLYRLLGQVERGITKLGHVLGYVLLPLVFCFGVLLGVQFGTKLGIEHSLTLTLYTTLFCLAWWTGYLLLIATLVGKESLKRILTDYLIPTGVFAAGTCSSLATLPINLANIKKCGVRNEVADFIVPLGAVVNMDGSALTFIAAAPFVIGTVYDMEISWTMMLIAWPAVVLFTIAAPGLPGGVGTALWSGTLFAGMLGLDGEPRSNFIATWVALTNGLPDTVRTSTNATCDGLMAVLFNRFFHRLHRSSECDGPTG